MMVCIKLTVIGLNNGPLFDLYHDADGYTTPFATLVTPATLLAGDCWDIDDNAQFVLIHNTGLLCEDLILPIIPCTTTTTTTIPSPTTTTTTTIPSPTTTTTTTCDPLLCDYGLLYNWYAVDTGKLAPTGWHVPTAEEWEGLRLYVAGQGWNYDGTFVAGTSNVNKQGKALAGTCGWVYDATTGAVGNTDYPSRRNISGFSGLPIGFRYGSAYPDGDKGYVGFWWSSTGTNSTKAVARQLALDDPSLKLYDTNSKYYGAGIRCVRDVYEGWEDDLPLFDIDNNRYDVVQLGTLLWTVQNLKVVHYNDGEDIPNVTDRFAWDDLTTGALCAYNNDWEIYACIEEPPSETTSTTTTHDGYQSLITLNDPDDVGEQVQTISWRLNLSSALTGWSDTDVILEADGLSLFDTRGPCPYPCFASSIYISMCYDLNSCIGGSGFTKVFDHDAGNTFWALITPTLYGESDISTIMSLATEITDWNKNIGDVLWDGFLDLSSYGPGDNVYMIMDYRGTTTTTTTTCDPLLCDYGLLYNWYAVDTGKLAPTGWHVPTAEEWEGLRLYVAGQGWNYDGTYTPGTNSANKQGKAVAATCGWDDDVTIGTVGNTDYPSIRNISGFSALPGGLGRGASFAAIGFGAYLWSSTTVNSTGATAGIIGSSQTYLLLSTSDKNNGHGVRCVTDIYEGWEEDLPVIDFDGNEYDVVHLGTQLWLVQNLKVVHYNDGVDIPNVTNGTQWDNLTTGACCAYDNDWETYACVPQPTPAPPDETTTTTTTVEEEVTTTSTTTEEDTTTTTTTEFPN